MTISRHFKAVGRMKIDRTSQIIKCNVEKFFTSQYNRNQTDPFGLIACNEN